MKMVELDPLTSVRLSNADGVIGFPLTVIRGGSGTYQLQFQPDIPDAKIVLQSRARSRWKIPFPSMPHLPLVRLKFPSLEHV